jgi:hypothetical protein
LRKSQKTVGATLGGLCAPPGSATSPVCHTVTRVVDERLNLDDDVMLESMRPKPGTLPTPNFVNDADVNTLSTSLNDALNIWHVPPGPHWWQYRMCLDVAQPAGMNSAAQSLSLRWLLYHARCRVHHTVCLCLSNPPLAMPNRISSFSPTVLLKSTRASLAALTSRVSHHRRTPGSHNGFACTKKKPTRLPFVRRRSYSCG